MNKKSMAFWFFIEIIAGVFAAYLLTSIALQAGEKTLFLQTKLARDFAIETNTLYAVPGNVYLQYPQNVSDFIVKFGDGIVKVYESEIIIASYPYVRLGEYNLEYTKEKKIDFLEFYKDNNKISFEKE